MKKIKETVVFTFFLIIIFGLLSTSLILQNGKFNSNQAKGETVSNKGKMVDYVEINPKFNANIYFLEIPLAIDYKTAKIEKTDGYLVNADYLKEVDIRIEALTVKSRTIAINQIPLQTVPLSPTGLDCIISIEDAKIQVTRIAQARNITAARIDSLLMAHTSKKLIVVLGPSKVNILFLNTDLDKLK